MDIHRNIDKANVQTLAYTILSRQGLNVKFRVKLYVKDKNDNDQYYHQEFVVGGERITTSIKPSSYLELSFTDFNDNTKQVIYVNDALRARIVRKISKLANTLEAYDAREVDILINDQNGTHLHSEVAKPILIDMGTQSMFVKAQLQSSINRVTVMLGSGELNSVISIYDFLLIFNRFKEFNFSLMTMEMLNYYLNMKMGVNRIEFGTSSIPTTNEEKITTSGYPVAFNKLTAMGSLNDIDDGETTIKPKFSPKKPSW